MDFANFWFQDAADGPNPGLIGNSLRFRGAQWLEGPSDLGAPRDGSYGCLSVWVKNDENKNGGDAYIINSNRSGSSYALYHERNSTTGFEFVNSGTMGGENPSARTAGKYRDYSAWYHIFVQYNAFDGLAGGYKMWINGVKEDSVRAGNWSNDNDWALTENAAQLQRSIGAAGTSYFSGYMAEIHVVDGKVLDVGTFGEYDSRGIWVPKKVLTPGINDGTVWSDYCTNFSTTAPAVNAFDGNTNTGASEVQPGGGDPFTFAPPGGIEVTSSFKFLHDTGSPADKEYFINGVSYGSPANNGWVDTGFTGTLTSFQFKDRRSGFYAFLKAIEVDGQMLIDGSSLNHGANGFYLDFSDPENIGKDRAGGNDFTPNGFDLTVGNGYYIQDCRTVSGGGSFAGAFDGNVSTGAGSENFSGEHWYWEPSGGYEWTSTVEVYGGEAAYDRVRLNNGSYTSMPGTSWKTIATGGGTITQLDLQDSRGNAAASINAIRIDGKILVDYSQAGGPDFDYMLDSPTNNYSTMNPLNDGTGDTGGGSLEHSRGTGDTNSATFGTFGVTSGKWYWEAELYSTSGGQYPIGIGMGNEDMIVGESTKCLVYSSKDGDKVGDGSYTSYGDSYGVNDIIGVELDLETQDIEFYKNGVSQGVAFTSTSISTDKPWFPISWKNDSNVAQSFRWNFGQRPFEYFPGTASGSTAFNSVLYTGNGTVNDITGLGFQPDFIWFKSRSFSASHSLWNSITDGYLATDSNEVDTPSGGDITITPNGFTHNASSQRRNSSGETYVAWCWSAGSAFTGPNNDGTIESTVKASPENGFSVVTYTGNNNNGSTVGHGLGKAPTFVMWKNRDSTNGWKIYSKPLFDVNPGYTLNFSSAAAVPSGITVAPDENVLTLTNDSDVNGVSRYVAYCFADTEDRVKTGYYVGNNSTDGPYIETGFRPAMILFKRTNGTGSWSIVDTVRDTSNLAQKTLYPDIPNAEDASVSNVQFLPSGFKLRNTWQNENQPYIYIAFAADYEPSDAKPLSSSKLERVAIEKPNTHFQTLIGSGGTGFGIIQYGGDHPTSTRAQHDGRLAVEDGWTGPIFDWAAQVRADTLNGYDDWYVPSIQETYLLYTVFKSNTAATAYGRTSNYTVPPINTSGTTQSVFPDFQEGGAEFIPWYGYHWTMTPSGAGAGIKFYFNDANIDSPSNGGQNQYARLVRREAFTGSEPAVGSAYAGGFLAGFMSDTENGSADWALIVSPSAGGQYGYSYPILEKAQATFPNGLWWIKDRDNDNNHQLVDSLRNTALSSNQSGPDASYAAPSGNSVAWCWKTNETFTPTLPGGTPTISARNIDAGFSMVRFNIPDPNQNWDVGHGLNQAPELVIMKKINASSNWFVQHKYQGNLGALFLNSISTGDPSSLVFGQEAPTDNHVNLNSTASDVTGDQIMYCWHSVPGFSSFGSYVGNGDATEGPFVYTGFRTAWVLVKAVTDTGNWAVLDSTRSPYNVANAALYPSSDSRELFSDEHFDLLSNGFKLRATARNTSGVTYIYAAFAEHPFGGSNVFPTNAR